MVVKRQLIGAVGQVRSLLTVDRSHRWQVKICLEGAQVLEEYLREPAKERELGTRSVAVPKRWLLRA